ncbi:hypothetical protein [Labrys wisconsinensis]|uniref:MFS transporter n=1 Tax=Labrys wisconsinensis TaxID=425677 RepID=A0ABU0JFB8_9HYPH|nr:hypothetical protein [Labrys wisconsinensis]MDQ0472973.1 hypothetical protein [Labrys wisconsinensis]
MTSRFADRLSTDTRFALVAAYLTVTAAFTVGMTLATLAHALIG